MMRLSAERDARIKYDLRTEMYTMNVESKGEASTSGQASAEGFNSRFGVGIDMEEVELFEGKDDIFISGKNLYRRRDQVLLTSQCKDLLQ
jgi:hypothetical protein